MLLARVDRLPPGGAPVGPGSRGHRPALRCRPAQGGDSRPRPGWKPACELLCDAEIIEEVAGSGSISSQSYRFTQTLLQDVIYQNLLLQRRTEMHGRIGAALERLYGDKPGTARGSDPARSSFRLSAEREKGARYLQAAGDRARTIYANDDALRLYEQALAALARDRADTAQAGNCRADCRSVRPGRPARDRARALRDGAAGLSQVSRPRRRGADPAQDRPAALGRRQARQGRIALRRSGSAARRSGRADRAGASLAGTRPPGVSHRRSRSRGKMGRRGAGLRTQL